MRLILSLLFSPFCIAHSAISAQPNILWFVVDDMSAHFSCYGEKLIQTPAVDKIAPPEAHESLVSRENVAEVPLTELSFGRRTGCETIFISFISCVSWFN